MKKRIVLLLGLALILTSGCKKGDDEVDSLSISVGPTGPYILPVPLRSCKGEAGSASTTDLSANTVEFTRFNYRWAGSGTYTMSAIFLRFNSGILAGGKFECVLAGDELGFILPAGGRILEPSETAEQIARCSLRCGGINVSGTVAYAYIPGTMKVVGIETDANGDSRPIVSETEVAMTYQKF